MLKRRDANGFINLCTSLGLHNKQTVCAVKAEVITPENIVWFWDICWPLLQVTVFCPHHPYSYDATGRSAMQPKVCKVVSLESSLPITALLLPERSSLVTGVTCVTAVAYACTSCIDLWTN
jgi:hypothetical protein